MDSRSYLPAYTRLGRPKECKSKIKLLALLLRRSANRILKDSFSSVKISAEDQSRKIKRMEKIHSVNAQICFYFAWEKLKAHSRFSKAKTLILRDVLNLSNRIQTSILRFSFDRIHKNIYSSNTNAYDRVMASRKNIMFQALKKIVNSRKKEVLFLLESNVHKKKQIKRLMTVNFILKSVRRRQLIEALNRLRIYSGKKIEKNSDFMENLQLQVQDLKVQVQNKNANISRLQEQLNQLKQHSSYKPPESSSSFIYYSNNNRSYGGIQKRGSGKFNSSFDKQSNEGSAGLVKDPSFGSILGGSFISYRSKNSLSKAGLNDSNASKSKCGCSHREKYQKYKASNQTLRKQLQIIKTELQFTKDMNEHMQNEIRTHMGDSEKDQKIDRLRQELKESQKEKQSLKEKVFKYQKYVNKLKMQFKTKIEEIYRRVKKSS